MDIHDDNELRNAPTLRSIPQVDPFVVPDGFFDRFPQLVQQRIAEDQATSGRWSWNLPGLMRPALGALALITVVILTWVLWPRSADGVQQEQLATYETPDHVSDDLEADEVYSALASDDPLLAEADLGLAGLAHALLFLLLGRVGRGGQALGQTGGELADIFVVREGAVLVVVDAGELLARRGDADQAQHEQGDDQPQVAADRGAEQEARHS
jgi:hypothetical protein